VVCLKIKKKWLISDSGMADVENAGDLQMCSYVYSETGAG
jgi:hypothetical protein